MTEQELKKEIITLKNHNETLKNELSFLRSLSDNFMERLYAIMNNSHETIILFFNNDFSLEHANVGFKDLLGYGEDEFDSETHQANIRKLNESLQILSKSDIKRQTSFTEEIILQHYEGRKLFIKFHVSKVFNPLNEDKGYLYLGYDITLEKEMKLKLEKHNKELLIKNKKIEEANRYKTEFLSNITHELRTPLSGILGIMKLIKFLKIENSELDKNLNIIEGNAKNLLAIINQLLDISRIEAGKMTVSYTKIPLAMIVSDAEILAGSLLSNKPEVEFIRKVNDPAKMIYIDNGKIRQILTNLIGNAVKFTKTGNITLETLIDDDTLFISVSDTGIGIKKEDIDKIFKPFVQADGSITRKYGGTGLGLSITEKLTTLLNGKIQILSKFGKGTEFRLTFKLSKDPKND